MRAPTTTPAPSGTICRCVIINYSPTVGWHPRASKVRPTDPSLVPLVVAPRPQQCPSPRSWQSHTFAAVPGGQSPQAKIGRLSFWTGMVVLCLGAAVVTAHVPGVGFVRHGRDTPGLSRFAPDREGLAWWGGVRGGTFRGVGAGVVAVPAAGGVSASAEKWVVRVSRVLPPRRGDASPFSGDASGVFTAAEGMKTRCGGDAGPVGRGLCPRIARLRFDAGVGFARGIFSGFDAAAPGGFIARVRAGDASRRAAGALDLDAGLHLIGHCAGPRLELAADGGVVRRRLSQCGGGAGTSCVAHAHALVRGPRRDGCCVLGTQVCLAGGGGGGVRARARSCAYGMCCGSAAESVESGVAGRRWAPETHTSVEL